MSVGRRGGHSQPLPGLCLACQLVCFPAPPKATTELPPQQPEQQLQDMKRAQNQQQPVRRPLLLPMSCRRRTAYMRCSLPPPLAPAALIRVWLLPVHPQKPRALSPLWLQRKGCRGGLGPAGQHPD